MTRAVVFLLALSVYLGTTPRAEADNQWQQPLGQSDWQVPGQQSGQSENQWQPQAQQPQAQPQPQQALGQSEWQQSPQSSNQWQSQPQAQTQQQIGQSDWQTPQGQSQWQQPGSNYAQQQTNSTYYGNASANQYPGQNGGNGQYQYQEPGAYLNQPYAGNPGKQKKAHAHKEKDPDQHKGQTAEIIKATAGALTRAVATTAPIAGSVMSSYFIGKGISRGGYNPMMFPGYGYGGYGGGYYGGGYPRMYPNPYGYGYGYNNGFMHF